MRGILAKISPMNSHNNDPYLSRTMHIYITYFSVVVMKQYEQRQPKNARGFVFVFVLFMFLFFDVQLQRDDYLGNDTHYQGSSMKAGARSIVYKLKVRQDYKTLKAQF